MKVSRGFSISDMIMVEGISLFDLLQSLFQRLVIEIELLLRAVAASATKYFRSHSVVLRSGDRLRTSSTERNGLRSPSSIGFIRIKAAIYRNASHRAAL